MSQEKLTPPMDKEVKRKWLKALRSGKYTQTEGTLKDSEGNCCLGVLCDLYAKEHGREWVRDETSYSIYRLKGQKLSDALPSNVSKWAGLGRHADPVVSYECYDANDDEEVSKVSLSQLNDEERLDFKGIADVISKSL